MTFDYTRAKATAERLIARFGQDVTLRQTIPSGDPWAPTLTEIEMTVKVVDLNQRERDASGTLVGVTRRTLYVSTSAGVTPAKGDRVVIGGTEHEIDEIRPLAPGGTNVMFEADLLT